MRVEVDSSCISAVEFDGQTMTVEFVGGKKYSYSDVPEELFEALLKAESKGRFMHEHVYSRYAGQRA